MPGRELTVQRKTPEARDESAGPLRRSRTQNKLTNDGSRNKPESKRRWEKKISLSEFLGFASRGARRGTDRVFLNKDETPEMRKLPRPRRPIYRGSGKEGKRNRSTGPIGARACAEPRVLRGWEVPCHGRPRSRSRFSLVVRVRFFCGLSRLFRR